jgi:ABC-type uncharacterized transport system fused permease/ATPase subunit
LVRNRVFKESSTRLRFPRFQEICLSTELYAANESRFNKRIKLKDVDVYSDSKYLEFDKLFSTKIINDQTIVYVDSTKTNMNKLALSIINYNSIHVEGDLGCGKTTLVTNLAKLTDNKLIKYQMDDYMDSKVSRAHHVESHASIKTNHSARLSIASELTK